ncbi:MAG TPA: sialidase family protein, partial [Mycobacteriales bacterium]|nr:sialidase family protein [Mycobacteriales bacterium]
NNCDQSSGAANCKPTAASTMTPDKIYVSVVPDGATSAPAPRLVASRKFDSFDSFVSDAVDKTGNIYVVWSERHPAQQQTWTMLSVSRNGGRSWSSPVKVERTPSTTVFPWVTAGDAGRIAVSYYGTASRGNSPQKLTTKAAPWSVYSSFSTNFGRTFSEYRTTGTMQKGPICTSGTGCATGSRNLLDFFETAADPQGCLVTAYADNSANGNAAIVSYVRQKSGPGLRAAGNCR